jgi:hypothetical protein
MAGKEGDVKIETDFKRLSVHQHKFATPVPMIFNFIILAIHGSQGLIFLCGPYF